VTTVRSSSEDLDGEFDVSTAFDNEGDKRCHVFNFSSPPDMDEVRTTLAHSSECGSQSIKKQKVDKHRSYSVTPTRCPKGIRRSSGLVSARKSQVRNTEIPQHLVLVQVLYLLLNTTIICHQQKAIIKKLQFLLIMEK